MDGVTYLVALFPYCTTSLRQTSKSNSLFAGSLTSRRRIMINRFKIWDISNKTCSGKFVRHICHFGMREVATLAHSRHLVANKFTYNFYPLAYDCTEQWYFDRVRKEEETGVVDINTRHYSNMEIVCTRTEKSESDRQWNNGTEND